MRMKIQNDEHPKHNCWLRFCEAHRLTEEAHEIINKATAPPIPEALPRALNKISKNWLAALQGINRSFPNSDPHWKSVFSFLVFPEEGRQYLSKYPVSDSKRGKFGEVITETRFLQVGSSLLNTMDFEIGPNNCVLMVLPGGRKVPLAIALDNINWQVCSTLEHFKDETGIP